jgi:hypothetical protein
MTEEENRQFILDAALLKLLPPDIKLASFVKLDHGLVRANLRGSADSFTRLKSNHVGTVQEVPFRGYTV